IKAEKRYSAGLYFLNSFTFGSARANSEQQLETFPGHPAANPQNFRNLDAEFGPTSYDVRTTNVTSVVYQLPFGKGRKWMSSAPLLLEEALGGWELTAINTASTGEPINVYFTPNSATDNTGRISDFRGQSQMRPNLIGDPTRPAGSPMVDVYFN